MLRLLRPLLTLASGFLLAAAPSAHFIWIHLQPGETPRIEVLFGDGVHEDSDRTLVRYIEGLDARTGSGAELSLTTRSFGLAGTLPAGTELVYATKDMAVFQRPGMTTGVKLDYDSKGALTLAAAGRTVGQTTEIVLSEDGAELIARVLFRGERAPGAVVFVPQWDSPELAQLTADEAGEVRFPRPPHGVIALKARVEVDADGEYEGQKYEGEHHYAMLTVTTPRALAQLHAGTNLEAYQRLEVARRNEARLPADVRGLAGVLTLELGGDPVRGEFEFTDGELIQCELPDVAAGDVTLVQAELTELLSGLFPARDDAALRSAGLRLAARDGHPHGRSVSADNRVWRVENGRLLSLERTANGRRHATHRLAFHEDERGRVLPTHVLHAVHDAETGALLESRTTVDEYLDADGLVLPKRRTVVLSSGRAVRIGLRNLEVDRPAPDDVR